MKKRSRFVNSIMVGSIVLLGALLARVPQGLGAATAQTQQPGTSGALALAAELKVDINNSGRPVLEGNEPTYTPWSTNQTWFSGGDTASASFSGVGVTFTRK